ncbi:MAG: hypothetical protein KGS09_14075 [Nitrospirae bacterium]|nr:hypothetical protein [Nitrospirota bacterium]MDE3218300.1 hypothetical protein [Nitrospirota bacterium]
MHDGDIADLVHFGQTTEGCHHQEIPMDMVLAVDWQDQSQSARQEVVDLYGP